MYDFVWCEAFLLNVEQFPPSAGPIVHCCLKLVRLLICENTLKHCTTIYGIHLVSLIALDEFNIIFERRCIDNLLEITMEGNMSDCIAHRNTQPTRTYLVAIINRHSRIVVQIQLLYPCWIQAP